MIPIQAVIDTNVIYAALRSRRGCSFRLVDDFMTGKTSWKWNVSNSCVLEYEEVLLREGVSSPIVEAFLGDLLVRATRIRIPRNFRPLAVDPDDDIFAELAMAAKADCVVTFNVGDLLPVMRFGIAVVTPAEFYRMM